jgi:DNA-binding beta-propeller fold protein YncE
MVKPRLLLCVLVLVIGESIGWSQPVPDTILLPDSLGPLRPGYHLAFGSSTDNIYVASESSDVIVVDGNTFQRIKRIYTDTPVGGALLVSQHNRLYCSYPLQGRIGIIDCATNTIVGSIQVGTRPKFLCYSSGNDKLYCGDTIDCTVSVIDCATNTVRKVIPLGAGLTVMAYEPTTGKVYVGTRDALLAISCSTDSVVVGIAEAGGARGLCINKRRQKLYVVLPTVVGEDTMLVISTPKDSVLGRLSCDGDLAPMLACNEATDRLYCVSEVSVTAIMLWEFDCIRDTLIRDKEVGAPLATVGLACDTVRNRLYHLCCYDWSAGYLDVLDCTTFDFISHVLVMPRPALLGMDPFRYRIMCVGGWYTDDADVKEMAAFDYQGDTLCVTAAVPLCGWTWYMYRNPVAGKLYFQWGFALGGLGVIDEHTNRLVGQVFMPMGDWSFVVYSRTSDKFYYRAPYQGLGIMDGTSDSIIKVIPMDIGFNSRSPCWCPEENKVYCYTGASGRRYVAVIDCYTDSVVGEIDLYGRQQLGFEYLGEDRLLCIQNDRLTLVGCRADTVLADTSIMLGEYYYSVAHTGDGEKVYFAHDGTLGVLSSSSLALLSKIDWPYGGPIGGGGFLVYSDTTHKLYWFSDWGDSMLAIDATSDTVVARLATSVSGRLACLDHTGRYLFCTGFYNTSLRVYDTQSDSLVGTYPHPQYPRSIIPAPEQHCIYLGSEDLILAYPDAPPGVEEAPSAEVRTTNDGPTVVHGVLFLPEAASRKHQAPSLMDISGRRVVNLEPGANDVRTLAPGVYFVAEGLGIRGQGLGRIRKVIVTR